MLPLAYEMVAFPAVISFKPSISEGDLSLSLIHILKKMTLEEKIGQLNLPVTGEITTGQAKSSDISARIKRGEVGGDVYKRQV